MSSVRTRGDPVLEPLVFLNDALRVQSTNVQPGVTVLAVQVHEGGFLAQCAQLFPISNHADAVSGPVFVFKKQSSEGVFWERVWVVVQFDREASQARDCCGANRAPHRAARPDPSLRKRGLFRMTIELHTTRVCQGLDLNQWTGISRFLPAKHVGRGNAGSLEGFLAIGG
jgi:hypothetical protein